MIMVRENMLCKRDLHRWMNNILTGFFIIIFFSQFSSLVYGERSGQKIFMGAVVCSLNLAPYCLCLFILIQPRLDFEKLPKNYQKTGSILVGPNGRVSWMRMLERRKLNLFCFTNLSSGDGYSWLPSKQFFPNIHNHSCSVKYTK